jgi:hypothetical protein
VLYSTSRKLVSSISIVSRSSYYYFSYVPLIVLVCSYDMIINEQHLPGQGRGLTICYVLLLIAR